MLQNADDISKQLKKQDKNANIIAGILVIGVGALAWATKIASLGGGLVLGGLSAAVFVSLWYFFQNIDDEESNHEEEDKGDDEKASFLHGFVLCCKICKF